MSRAVLYAADCEVAVILRVVEQLSRLVCQHDCAKRGSSRCLLGCVVELHILPFAVGFLVHFFRGCTCLKCTNRSWLVHPFIGFLVHLRQVHPLGFVLYLARHSILPCFDAQAASHVYEEDVARTLVGNLRLHHANRSLCDAQSLLVRVKADVLLYPLNKLHRVGAESVGSLLAERLLEVLLERYCNQLVLNTRRELVGRCVVAVLENLGCDIAQVLVAECGEYAHHAVFVVAVAVDEVDDSLLVAARFEDILCSALTDALRLLHSGEGGCVCLADAVLKSKAALVLLVHLVADVW